MRVNKDTQKMKDALTHKPQATEPMPKPRISCGCTMLDLACSDTLYAFRAGTYAHIVGDSSSGKTILAFTLLAEMNLFEQWDDYEFVYDDVEHANQFDMVRLFGQGVADRVRAPRYTKDGKPVYSRRVEDFQDNILGRCEKRKKFAYILDSFDALTCIAELAKAKEAMQQREKEFKGGDNEDGDKAKKLKGSFKMDKAKIAGETLRMISEGLSETESFLIIISQTRDNTDPMSMSSSTVSGGRALKFYASHQIWLRLGKRIKSKERSIGVYTIATVKKSKATGKYRECTFPIYYDYGVDDIGACVDFLVAEGFWPVAKNTITAKTAGWSCSGTRDKVIRSIESAGVEDGIRKFTREAWLEIEEELKLNRKARFG